MAVLQFRIFLQCVDLFLQTVEYPIVHDFLVLIQAMLTDFGLDELLLFPNIRGP